LIFSFVVSSFCVKIFVSSLPPPWIEGERGRAAIDRVF
jgi:hypothetical protein